MTSCDALCILDSPHPGEDCIQASPHPRRYVSPQARIDAALGLKFDMRRSHDPNAWAEYVARIHQTLTET